MLERSSTRFETTELEPFMVKGKAKPVQAWSLGPPGAARPREDLAASLPLDRPRATRSRRCGPRSTGRGPGNVTLVEVVGEPGIGKSRMLGELHEEAGGCERAASHVRGLHELDDRTPCGGSCCASCSDSAGKTPITS